MRNDGKTEHEPYGFMEREVAFKLLASHALVDREYFYWLRDDPEKAAEHLHIRLKESDLAYLRDEVKWDEIEKVADPIREALRLDIVTNSW